MIYCFRYQMYIEEEKPPICQDCGQSASCFLKNGEWKKNVEDFKLPISPLDGFRLGLRRW